MVQVAWCGVVGLRCKWSRVVWFISFTLFLYIFHSLHLYILHFPSPSYPSISFIFILFSPFFFLFFPFSYLHIPQLFLFSHLSSSPIFAFLLLSRLHILLVSSNSPFLPILLYEYLSLLRTRPTLHPSFPPIFFPFPHSFTNFLLSFPPSHSLTRPSSSLLPFFLPPPFFLPQQKCTTKPGATITRAPQCPARSNLVNVQNLDV